MQISEPSLIRQPCRRPLKLAVSAGDAARRVVARRALALLLGVAGVALGAAVEAGGVGWLIALAPSAMLGAIFLRGDLRGRWREGWAEVVGAAAFALMAASFVRLGGWSWLAAWVLAGAMLARAVPTVVLVRALVRRAKGEDFSCWPALVVAAVAAGVATIAWRAGLAPGLFPLLAGLLFVRAIGYAARSRWRARTLGMIELAVGVIYVATLAAAWSAFRLATP